MTTRQPPSLRGTANQRQPNFPHLPTDRPRDVILDPDAPDDHEPMPDAMQQGKNVRATIDTMQWFFRDRGGILVDGDSPVYYLDEEGRQRMISPDCYVALEVDPGEVRRRNGYFIHEVGRPPSVVIEVASVTTAPNDLGPKRDLYARLGVGEYWRFDGTGGIFYGEPLVGETLVEGEYIRLPINYNPDTGLPWAHSPTLGLDLWWEPERLLLFDPVEGVFLRNLAEAEAARQAAEARHQAAEAEVERLTEELQRLRG